MYEEQVKPQLKGELCGTTPIRFGIKHSDAYRRSNDPNIEGLHRHRFIEIFFNVSSNVSFVVNSLLHPVPTGSAVVSLPGDIHMCVFQKSAVHDYVCLWIDADLAHPFLSFLKDGDRVYCFDGDDRKRMTDLCFSLIGAYEKADAHLEAFSILLQILLHFKENKKRPAKQLALPDAFQNILEDVHKRFAEIGSVNEILQTHFVSSTTLTRWFRKYTHSSPREYLETVRLSHAIKLLTKGASVTEACMSSGFSDTSHFIHLFKRKFGETPLSYKRKNAAKCEHRV